MKRRTLYPRTAARPPLVLALPFLACAGLFAFVPAGLTLWQAADLGAWRLVVRDPLVYLAAANTLGFSLAFALCQTAVALAGALLVNGLPRRWAMPLAAAFFSTHLVGATFGGALFAAILSGRQGLLNTLLLYVGVVDAPVAFLTTPVFAMPVLVAVATYAGFGFATVYLLAALVKVDLLLSDAARIDGCGSLRRAWHVTIPQVRPTLAVLAVAAVFWGMTLFELPFVLFDGPGPGYRVLTLAMLVFSAGFERGDTSYAAAVAVLLAGATLLAGVVLALAVKLGREEVTL